MRPYFLFCALVASFSLCPFLNADQTKIPVPGTGVDADNSKPAAKAGIKTKPAGEVKMEEFYQKVEKSFESLRKFIPQSYLLPLDGLEGYTGATERNRAIVNYFRGQREAGFLGNDGGWQDLKTDMTYPPQLPLINGSKRKVIPFKSFAALDVKSEDLGEKVLKHGAKTMSDIITGDMASTMAGLLSLANDYLKQKTKPELSHEELAALRIQVFMFKLGGFKKIEEQKTGIEPPEDDSYVRPNAEQFLAALELEKLLSEKYNVAPIDPKEISLQMLSAEYGPGIDLGEMEGAILDAFGGFDAEGEGVFDEDALPLPPIPPPVPGEVDDPGFHHGARDPSGLSPSDI